MNHFHKGNIILSVLYYLKYLNISPQTNQKRKWRNIIEAVVT